MIESSILLAFNVDLQRCSLSRLSIMAARGQIKKRRCAVGGWTLGRGVSLKLALRLGVRLVTFVFTATNL